MLFQREFKDKGHCVSTDYNWSNRYWVYLRILFSFSFKV